MSHDDWNNWQPPVGANIPFEEFNRVLREPKITRDSAGDLVFIYSNTMMEPPLLFAAVNNLRKYKDLSVRVTAAVVKNTEFEFEATLRAAAFDGGGVILIGGEREIIRNVNVKNEIPFKSRFLIERNKIADELLSMLWTHIKSSR